MYVPIVWCNVVFSIQFREVIYFLIQWNLVEFPQVCFAWRASRFSWPHANQSGWGERDSAMSLESIEYQHLKLS